MAFKPLDIIAIIKRNIRHSQEDHEDDFLDAQFFMGVGDSICAIAAQESQARNHRRIRELMDKLENHQ